MNSYDAVVTRMSELTTHSTEVSAILGARALVLGAFVEQVIPLLTSPQCSSLAEAFKRSVEDIMALMDDVCLPAQFHSTLLSLTNSTVASLNRRRLSEEQ